MEGNTEGLNPVFGASDGTMEGRPEMLGLVEGFAKKEKTAEGRSPRVDAEEPEGTTEGAPEANANRRSSM